MKVAIMGAGVIGVTTAYYLAREGVQVTVIDRQDGPGLETSFANAGQLSPGYATPWAAPGIPLKALKWLLQRHAPLSIRPDGSLFQLQWLWSMWRNCSPARYAVNKERMLRLASFSRECLIDLRRDIGNHYEGRQAGTLQVFRTHAQLQAARRDVEILDRLGIEHQLLPPEALHSIEPALAVHANALTGGLRLPLDETGDCQMFVRDLAARCKSLGVRFLFGREILSLEREAQRVRHLRLRSVATPSIEARIESDHVVMALGSYSRGLASQLGLSLPVYPLKGYSLTVPISNKSAAPQSTVMDETYKVAVTRFDQRIRVGGMAEVAGYDLRLNASRRATLEKVLHELFPGAGSAGEALFWTGLRPMTPDSTPIVGGTDIPNLWLNTGHGTLGWTMACGSARLLSEMIRGKKTSIRTEGLSLSRYRDSNGAIRPRPWQAAPAH